MAGRELVAAAVLAAVLVAVPLLPTTAVAVLGVGDDATDTPTTVTIASGAGAQLMAAVPTGWTVEQRGDAAVLTDGARTVRLAVHDRGERSPEVVAERLIRRDRLSGLSAALDGGRGTAPDGLAGPTCVVVGADDVSGRCVLLADDDVVVFVQTLGSAAEPAIGLDEVSAGLGRPTAAA